SMEPRTGTPTDWAEPVEEPGSARWWPWSCATQHLPGHADELRDLGRTREGPLAHDADPRTVDLLVVGAGLDPRCLERREDVAHVPVGDPRRTLGRHDPRGVLRLSGEALLPVRVGDLRVGLHDDARLGTADPGDERARGVRLPVGQEVRGVLAQ